MPTYDYECDACGHKFELFQSITEKPQRKCPQCGKLQLRRLFGPGAAIVFKGSGFYETDYRSESYRRDAERAKKAIEGKDNGKAATKKEPGAKPSGTAAKAKEKP